MDVTVYDIPRLSFGRRMRMISCRVTDREGIGMPQSALGQLMQISWCRVADREGIGMWVQGGWVDSGGALGRKPC